jgi:tRNA (guanine10-N2)-methyltransferase
VVEHFEILEDLNDPPYGIRAGARKSGRKDTVSYSISEEKRFDHIPSTQNYPVEEVMLDLLHTAASSLVM